MTVHVQLADDRAAFKPGQALEGVVFWDLVQAPASVELHLCWHTEGKGTTDSATVDEVKVASPPPRGSHAFRIRMPEGPCSFSGKLISLLWTLEASAGAETASRAIVLSPTGEEIRLHKGAAP